MSRGPGEATPSPLDAVDAVTALASSAGVDAPTARRAALELAAELLGHEFLA